MKAEWENLGGVLKFHGTKIRKGDHFIAYEDEIPKGFRDVIKLIGPAKEEIVEVPEEDKAEIKEIVADVADEVVSEMSEIEKELVEAESEMPVRRNPVKVPKYKLEKKGGWYNIINIATGKKMNTAALRKDDADAFLASLDQ